MRLYLPEEALLKHRETSGFPDQHVCDLTDFYTDKKHSVACVLLVQPLAESLQEEERAQGTYYYIT